MSGLWRKKPKICKSAREVISKSKLRNVRLFEGEILNFMKDHEGNFDIIYFDACGTLPSAKQNTLKVIGYVFQFNKLTSPGALITNFSFPTNSGPKEQHSSDQKEGDQTRELLTEYLKYRLDNTWMNEGSPARNAERRS